MAAIIALFHDIGRLAPYLKQNNENPPETDHAEAGVSYLKSSNLMNELDEITQNIDFESIRLHNKQEIPHKTPESIVFYAKLLRDADKLDSWQTTVEHLINRNPKPNTALDIALNDTRILSPTICNTILDNKIPSRSELKTFADFKLFQLSWVFDLNFKKSFQLLNQKQYIRTIYESLPKNNSVIDIYRMVRIYVENKIW
jgi:hypothetical protein